MASWEDDAAPAARNEELRGQLARISLSEATLALFESEDVDLNLLMELDAEALDEIDFKDGERDRLLNWLKAVRAFRTKCKALAVAIPP